MAERWLGEKVKRLGSETVDKKLLVYFIQGKGIICPALRCGAPRISDSPLSEEEKEYVSIQLQFRAGHLLRASNQFPIDPDITEWSKGVLVARSPLSAFSFIELLQPGPLNDSVISSN
ncbi:MAG: hypothetical protein Q7S60_04895 [bacterium]|nr:hypothetical protein [bacterium]